MSQHERSTQLNAARLRAAWTAHRAVLVRALESVVRDSPRFLGYPPSYGVGPAPGLALNEQQIKDGRGGCRQQATVSALSAVKRLSKDIRDPTLTNPERLDACTNRSHDVSALCQHSIDNLVESPHLVGAHDGVLLVD